MGDANNIIVGAAAVSIGGTDIGFTKGGVQVRYEPEFFEVIADQAVGVVRKARSLERMFVATTLLEVTLSQIRLAFMQPASNLVGSTLTLGYNDPCWVDEVAIVLTGKGPNCGTRTYTFPRGITFGNREINQTREEEQAFEVEFEILKQSDGTFGTIVDS